MKMKFLCIITTACIIFTLIPIMNVFATDESDTATIEEVTVDETPFDFSKPIRFGYYSTFTDVISDIDSINNKGYGYDVFQKISENSGLEFEFVPIADSMLEAVSSGYVDIGGFNTRNDERREQVLYSENPYTKTYIALMSKDMNLRYADLSAIDGKTVSVYDENVGTEALNEFCEENNISVEYVYSETETYMEQETDLYITYSEDPTSLGMNNILNLGVYNLYLITSHENSDLMEVIDKEFYDVISTEGNFFMELEEKYLAENLEINHRGLTAREIEILRQRPLEVGYVTGFAPISYTNEQNEPDGALIEILNSYSERYGFEVNYQPFSLEDPIENQKEFDVLLTLYDSDDMSYEHYSATESYYEIPMYAVINHAVLDTISPQEIFDANPTIGSLPYKTVDYDAFLNYAPNTEIVFYNNWHNLLDDLAAGKVDLLICTESATTYTEVYFDDLYMSTIVTDTKIPMQFFINNEIAKDYVPIFNVMGDKLSESDYRAIIETNANDILPDSETGFFEFVVDNWYYFIILLFIIVAGFIMLYYRGQLSKQKALLKSYNTDQLTGLVSFQKFGKTVDQILQKSRPGEYEIISFDIDMFKTINTHFSTERGTNILIAIGDVLKKVFKGTEVVVSRRAADQFLIFRRVGEGGDIRELYRTDILPAIEDNVSDKYKVSLSFGNAITKEEKVKGTALIGQADSARNAGKNTHKTTFITFDDKMRKEYDNKINITFRMEQALKDKEFIVVYQPKVDFNSLTLGGAEALVRWVPQLGDTIYPDEFIPVFEENGFISYLDLYVLEKVCIFMKENISNMEIPRISVNLSAHTVLADNIVSRISNILTQYDLTHDMIELELTESAVEANTEKFLSVVKRFKKLGFAISIDDFGAGVSSLNRLSAIEADVLKLDKAFFDLKDQGSNSTVVVTDVINMAKHLNMKVVAEGVETGAQATWLKGVGCDYAQGYYFAKPISAENFKQLLIEKKHFTISLL